MIEYKFNWADASSDPRTTIRDLGSTPLLNERTGGYIQKWRIHIAGSSPDQSIIDALTATGNIAGSVVTSTVT